MAKVEIIAIGDEVLIGEVVNTNSSWLGAELSRRGFLMDRTTVIGDVEGDMIEVIGEALRHADLVITTGGLGPTNDDRTTAVLSKMFRSPLVNHEGTLKNITAYAEKRELPLNELNRKQALVPAAATVIENLNGTAPAMMLERDGKVLVALPGVPFEMKAIFENTLFAILEKKFPATGNNIHISAITFGLPESVLAERIKEWEEALPQDFHLAYLPSPSRVSLRISVYGTTDRDATERAINEQFEKLKELLGIHFVGYGGKSIEERIAEIMTKKRLTLSTAESCSGGTIASRITALAGASQYFAGGIVAYSNEIKARVLGIDTKIIDRHGAVSREVVEQMAERAAILFESDYSIATSGIAGPTGGTAEKPVGMVWMAVSSPHGTRSVMKQFGNLRQQNIEYTASDVLFMLLEELGK